jgi:hypothetical protein
MREEPDSCFEGPEEPGEDALQRRLEELGLPFYVDDPVALDSMATIVIEHDRGLATHPAASPTAA